MHLNFILMYVFWQKTIKKTKEMLTLQGTSIKRQTNSTIRGDKEATTTKIVFKKLKIKIIQKQTPYTN